jgi:hypothetical protein
MITTKTGDQGKTTCGSQRVDKDDILVETVGEIDELESVLELVNIDEKILGDLRAIMGEIGNNSESIYQIYYNSTSTGISKLRFTFNDISFSELRIAGIWLYNYNSNGMKEICVGRDGGEMYGNLYPYATASNLDLRYQPKLH